MNIKKFLVGTATGALMLGAMIVPALAAPAAKIDVCHVEGNGSYHLINVSENAVPAHLDHGDGLPGKPVPDMKEGYYFTTDCKLVFIRSAEITSPDESEEFDVGDEVTFAATLIDKDNDDSVQWAVRKGTCLSGVVPVWGNVNGHNDPYTWDGVYFSSTANTTGWEAGNYCFIFNPTESAGDTAIRETRQFTLIQSVCDPSVVETGGSYGGHYGSTVTPVTVTNEDCSTVNVLKIEKTQSFQQGQPEDGPAGWAGWSCLESGYPHVVGGGIVPESGTVIAQGMAKPGAAAIDGHSYPVYPNYNYPIGEEGWVVEAAGPTPPTSIYVLCGQ